MKIIQIDSEAVIKRTGQCVKRKLTPRHLPNSIGAVGEDYVAKWIVSQEQKDKIRKFWEQVPQALKDAIKQSH